MKSTIRYKLINHKRRPLCDYHGECNNLAHKEVYPENFGSNTKNSGWSYLCRKHFNQEYKKLKGKISYCSTD